MQLQKEGKTWRLLQPRYENSDKAVWRSYLIE
jgi:hypothetical protein